MSDGDRPRGGFLAGSAIVSALRAARDGSSVLAAASVLGDRLAAGGDRSRVLGTLAGAGDRLARWSRDSWLLGPPAEPAVVVVDLRETYTVGPLLASLDRIVAWAAPRWRGSAPARTLVRVTDVTADAPVRLLSWLILGLVLVPAALAVAAGRAPSGWLLVALGVALLGTRERRSASRLRTSAAGRVLAALLVPPEPVDERIDDERTDDERSADERGGDWRPVDERTDDERVDGKFDEE